MGRGVSAQHSAWGVRSPAEGDAVRDGRRPIDGSQVEREPGKCQFWHCVSARKGRYMACIAWWPGPSLTVLVKMDAGFDYCRCWGIRGGRSMADGHRIGKTLEVATGALGLFNLLGLGRRSVGRRLPADRLRALAGADCRGIGLRLGER